MKLLIRIILIGTLTYFLSYVLPWWVGMAASFLVCLLIPGSGLIAFIAGFLGVGLVWMGQAWSLDVANAQRFSGLIVELFPLNDAFMLIVASGAVGAISGGFAALSGCHLRKIFQKPQQRGLYTS